MVVVQLKSFLHVSTRTLSMFVVLLMGKMRFSKVSFLNSHLAVIYHTVNSSRFVTDSTLFLVPSRVSTFSTQ